MPAERSEIIYQPTFGCFVRTAWSILTSPLAGSSLRFVGVFFRTYLLRQYGVLRPMDAALSVDRAIPFRKQDLATYWGIFLYPFAVVRFLRRTFGIGTDAEIRAEFERTSRIYKGASRVFDETQTTFLCRRQATGAGAALLHLFDRNRNCYPSLHAAVIGKAYTVAARFIARSDDTARYEPVREELFRNLVRIMESCYTVKQHSIRDLAAGFALLTVHEPDFSEAVAERVFDVLFADGSLPEETVREVRLAARAEYVDILARWRSGRYPDIAAVLIGKVGEMKTRLP